MAKTDRPRFIKVAGEYYMLETAATESSSGENLKQTLKELEGYFSHKGNGAKETVPAKEPKQTEKTLSMDPPPDKEAAQNVADKFSSPPKEFYKGKESKKDLKNFQLKPETPKANEENMPDRMPSKIQVKGFIYERVEEPQTPPDKIRVNGQVYERVEQPPVIRVGGKTFVKLSDEEARAVMAAKKADDVDEASLKKWMKGLPGKSESKVTKCVRKLEKHNDAVDKAKESDKKAPGKKVKNPDGLCAKIMRALDKEAAPKGGKKK